MTLTTTNLEGLALVHRGKVRETYEVDEEHLLLVATDRLSAFDVVFDQPIPDKGAVLTRLSALVDGVKIGSGNRSASRNPSGSGWPQTIPLRWYSAHPEPAR